MEARGEDGVMAQLLTEGDEVVVRLGWLEKVGAVHGDIRFPRADPAARRRGCVQLRPDHPVLLSGGGLGRDRNGHVAMRPA